MAVFCLLVVLFTQSAFGQSAPQAALVKATPAAATSVYRRHVVGSGKAIYYAPASWVEMENATGLTGPNKATLRVLTEVLPDGYSLMAYVAASIQALRGAIGEGEPPVARSIRMSGVDAREFSFDTVSPERGRIHFRAAVAVHGTVGIAVVVVVPTADTGQADEMFDTTVDSVTFASDSHRVSDLDAACHGVFSATETSDLSLRRELVSAVDGTSTVDRERAVQRLARVCERSPRLVADLLLDSRPIVRAAAVDALAASGIDSEDLAFFALDDADDFVKSRAAHTIAESQDAVLRLKARFGPDFEEPGFLRVAALLNVPRRVELARSILETPPPPAPPPPPPLRIAPKGPPAASRSAPEAPELGGIPGGVPGALPIDRPSVRTSRESIALALLNDVPSDAFAIPFPKIMATGDQRLLAEALAVANRRGESVPVEVLLSALASSSEEVATSALFNLGRLATVADIARIESAHGASKVLARQSPTVNGAVLCIRLREELVKAGTDPAARSRIVDNALSRATTTNERLWILEAEDETKAPRNAPDEPGWIDRIDIGSLGENVYPRSYYSYAAASDPEQAVLRTYDGLLGVQFGSARDQSSFALYVANLRESLALRAGTSGADLSFERFGLAPHDPISVAVWTPERQAESGDGVLRTVAIAKVVDRDRFERFAAAMASGTELPFSTLGVAAATLVRMMSMMPALTPLAAFDIVTSRRRPPAPPPPMAAQASGWTARYVRDDVYLGVPFRAYVRRIVHSTGGVETGEMCIAYSQNHAIVASSPAALHDVIRRLRDGERGIGTDSAFQGAIREGGDIVYLSKVGRGVFGDSAFEEHGALTVSSDGWSNSFQLSFADTAASDLLETFPPADAVAPRTLLPKSTIAYGVGRVGGGAAWDAALAPLAGAQQLPRFSKWFAEAGIDVEKDLVPELGSECGAALLDLPSIAGNILAPRGLVVFVEIRDGRADAVRDLLARISKSTSFAKSASGSRVAVKNGFLVVAADAETLARLDEPDKLVGSADYVRALASLPERTTLFGGFNVQAAIDKVEHADLPPETRIVIAGIESMARAFKSHVFWMTPARDADSKSVRLDARLSAGIDHDGSHVVSELSNLQRDRTANFAEIETAGETIVLQDKLEHLKIRIRSSTPASIPAIRESLSVDGTTVDSESSSELVATIQPRIPATPDAVAIPVTDPSMKEFLNASRDVRSDAATVQKQARDVAGTETDAWSVAKKLSAWTHKNLKWKRVDDADAEETLATREADCLEFSELYVAMARSVGLPARIVHGVAYAGGTFSGHAWVEVWIGRWTELDPTWGTDYVDATHVRTSTTALIQFAALGLARIEVVEAPGRISDERRDPARLVEKICSDLNTGSNETLADALDPAVSTDAALGCEAWSSLDGRGRRGVIGYFTRLRSSIARIVGDGAAEGDLDYRVANLAVAGDRASAVIVGEGDGDDVLTRLRLVSRQGAWSVVEVESLDNGMPMVAENMGPAFETIRARRKDPSAQAADYSSAARAIAIGYDNTADALGVLDKALEDDPKNASLLLLRARYLLRADRRDEALGVYKSLVEAEAPIPAALFGYAEALGGLKERDDAFRATLYARYAALVTDDPRPHSRIAEIAGASDIARAEREYREAVSRDPRGQYVTLDLAYFLFGHNRVAEAVAVLDGSPAFQKDEGFVALLGWLAEDDGLEPMNGLVRSYPERVDGSVPALVIVGRNYLIESKPAGGIRYLRRALELEPKSRRAYVPLIDSYLMMKEWRIALRASESLIAFDDDDPEAHFERACALAQLRRPVEAMTELRRTVDLDGDYLDTIREDRFLEPLASRPDFRKLVAAKAAVSHPSDH